MTKELWERFEEELSDEVDYFLRSHNLSDYDKQIIVEGISDKAHNYDFWGIEEYVYQIYEPEYLAECAEENSYRHMVSVESRYW